MRKKNRKKAFLRKKKIIIENQDILRQITTYYFLFKAKPDSWGFRKFLHMDTLKNRQDISNSRKILKYQSTSNKKIAFHCS